jgi:hypothetical protein
MPTTIGNTCLSALRDRQSDLNSVYNKKFKYMNTAAPPSDSAAYYYCRLSNSAWTAIDYCFIVPVALVNQIPTMRQVMHTVTYDK